MKNCLCLLALLLVACGKEAPQPELKAKAEKTAAAKPAPAKKLPPVPQGKLPKMDPEKAKFIAVPSTPKDPEVKKVEQPAIEAKKTAPLADETKAADKPAPEVKKAEVPAVSKP